MILRIGRKKFIKPRRCPDCNKFCLMANWWTSERCKKCHKIHEAHRKTIKNHRKRKILRANGADKYTSAYYRYRKSVIEEHPYCALCGCTSDLTTHHIGGGMSHKKLTVLCQECHTAYERWNEKGRYEGRLQKIIRVLQSRLRSAGKTN